MRRVVGLLVVLTLITVTPVLADVEFGESSQGAFGITGQGVDLEGAEGMGNYDEAWDLFSGTIEGARILGRIDGNREFDVTVEVLPANEVENGDEVWGRASLFVQPNDQGQTRARIIIIKDDSRTVKQIANTIYHEFRHVEHWLDGDFDEGADNIHDGSDAGMVRYVGQAMEVVTGTSSTTTLPPTRTPISDALLAEAAADEDEFRFDSLELGRIFDEIGEALDSIQRRQQDAIYLDSIDLEFYIFAKGQFGLDGVEIVFNESVFECGDATDQRRVVCVDQVLDMAPGQVFIASMIMVGDIPQADPDRSYIYSLVLNSDRDGANDWRPRPPFDWDLFQGTDRWYQLIWDHRAQAWSLTVTQLTASGRIPSGIEASSVRAVIEGNTIVFFVSMEEFEASNPSARLTAFHHDGNFGEATRGADVSGPDPTASLIVVPEEPIDFGW